MQYGEPMEIPPEHTTTLAGLGGAALTAIGLILAGFFKSRSEQKKIENERIRIEAERQANANSHEQGMTREQREWVESLWHKMQDLYETTDNMRTMMESEREVYEKKILELRQGYRQELEEQEIECRVHIAKLQKQIDGLKAERKLWVPDLHACIKPPKPDEKES